MVFEINLNGVLFSDCLVGQNGLHFPSLIVVLEMCAWVNKILHFLFGQIRKLRCGIDLFSLYVLFSHFRPGDVMLLEGIVSFKCRLMHVQMYA